MKIDLSKSYLSYVKSGVPGVLGVHSPKNNDITECYKEWTWDTLEKTWCPEVSRGHQRTPEKNGGVPNHESTTDCNNNIKDEEDTADTMDTENYMSPTSSQRRPSYFISAHKWIIQNKSELMAAGWTVPEFYREDKSQGIAWCPVWDKPGLKIHLQNDGCLVFQYSNATGNRIRQTAFPRCNHGRN